MIHGRIQMPRLNAATKRRASILSGAVVAVAAFFALLRMVPQSFWPVERIQYGYTAAVDLGMATTTATSTVVTAEPTPPPFVVTHVATPEPLKAVYMTSWAAGNAAYRKELMNLVDTTEVNAVVIDVKDYTGRISFAVNDPQLAATGAAQNRIPDIQKFIGQLHDKGVYVIGRISSFQDSYMINIHPDWAVKTEEGAIWQDYKGVKWLDAGAQPVWDYLISIGKEAHADGFDELNFDYVRYPSDGNLKDIAYSWSDGRTREQVMRDFFAYIHAAFSQAGIPTSVDFFGLTTSAEDDLGIGQVLTDALANFDYVSPMVYPSHFANGFLGFAKPAEHPYDVVKYAMDHAIAKAEATSTLDALEGGDPIASTTPQRYAKVAVDKSKLRPWLQAFDLGATYTPAMVRQQIQATNDAGLSSWMLWNAASEYDAKALVVRCKSANACE
jgi:hypothetical protein